MRRSMSVVDCARLHPECIHTWYVCSADCAVQYVLHCLRPPAELESAVERRLFRELWPMYRTFCCWPIFLHYHLRADQFSERWQRKFTISALHCTPKNHAHMHYLLRSAVWLRNVPKFNARDCLFTMCDLVIHAWASAAMLCYVNFRRRGEGTQVFVWIVSTYCKGL